MNSFDELSLAAPLKRALEALQFTAPTPIQASTIPVALKGRDIIGCAQTGTGKTAAFVLPILNQMLESPAKRALVLAPTRELAVQIEKVIFDFTRFAKQIRTSLVIGGASMNTQFRTLRNDPSFVIATPGRLIDHMERGSIQLENFDVMILDEADRMLDMGFAPAIEVIFRSLPEERQTLLFSATLPPAILKLTSRFLKNPERVTVGSTEPNTDKIKMSHIQVIQTEKNDRVLEEIKKRSGTVLVFARTQIRTERLANFLAKSGVRAGAIHGGRTQSQRLFALNQFRNGATPVLVATDVASRGLDIPQIELVVNYDLPQSREDFVHRVGRTARAGAEGEAISFVTPEESRQWRDVSGQGKGSSHDGQRGDFRKSHGGKSSRGRRFGGGRGRGFGRDQGHSQGQGFESRGFEGRGRGNSDRQGRPSGGQHGFRQGEQRGRSGEQRERTGGQGERSGNQGPKKFVKKFFKFAS
jgi:ATP-dependent RNA helicase RhlE